MDDDREIVQKVKSGDYDAFEALVEKYQGRIYRHLRKMVKDTSHAEDLLQETFLNAYRGLSGFEGGSTFSTWLFRIATNTALMHPEKASTRNGGIRRCHPKRRGQLLLRLLPRNS